MAVEPPLRPRERPVNVVAMVVIGVVASACGIALGLLIDWFPVSASAEAVKIDTLWDELHFVTGDPMRQYKDFIFFERAEPPRFMQEAAFDFARSEDKDATSESKIKQLREAYLTKARKLGVAVKGEPNVEIGIPVN